VSATRTRAAERRPSADHGAATAFDLARLVVADLQRFRLGKLRFSFGE
jgi:hypothetical protein